MVAHKTGAICIIPKIGAMKKLRLSIHSAEHIYLRHLFTQRRLELGLSQRALADKFGIVHSLYWERALLHKETKRHDIPNPLRG